ncbi:MAG: YbaK/EbsC family protein [Candidatus Thiodiazotropha sp. 'RUGA']|nr:YbaK/EbsC family protein [Candidatus Thiodiazotropha sp. 'RUGA']
MSISNTVRSYIEGQSIPFEVISHRHTQSSMESAGAAHVESDHLAKAVIVKEGDEYMMVVVPSDYHIHLGKLHKLLGREVGLATESELMELFPDCERGAIPPLGTAYRLITLVDSNLLNQNEVYFESGDHEHLIKVSGEEFAHLLGEAELVDVTRNH